LLVARIRHVARMGELEDEKNCCGWSRGISMRHGQPVKTVEN
jgi:hypothetical protein